MITIDWNGELDKAILKKPTEQKYDDLYTASSEWTTNPVGSVYHILPLDSNEAPSDEKLRILGENFKQFILYREWLNARRTLGKMEKRIEILIRILNRKAKAGIKPIKITIADCLGGSNIFTHKCENNTLAKTVERAVRMNKNLAHSYFEGAELSGVNFSGGKLADCDFTMAELSGANFSNSDLSHCTFSGTNLKGANFDGAIIFKTDFMGANLEGAILETPLLRGAEM